jgi:rare lipoprotein A
VRKGVLYLKCFALKTWIFSLGMLNLCGTGCVSSASYGKARWAPDSPLAQSLVALHSGKASFYGNHFREARTASGEIYDPEKLTAAHPSLPFGSLVLVRKRHSNRYVIVRINDRGPHIAGRVIDLSQAAAQKMGLKARGVARVDLFLLKPQSLLSSQL